jgi:hypothetical protein
VQNRIVSTSTRHYDEQRALDDIEGDLRSRYDLKVRIAALKADDDPSRVLPFDRRPPKRRKVAFLATHPRAISG